MQDLIPFFDIKIDIRREAGQCQNPGHLEAVTENAAVGASVAITMFPSRLYGIFLPDYAIWKMFGC